MSNIVVVVFDDMRQAGELRSALMRLDAQKEIHVDDSVVVVKNAAGELTIKDNTGRTVLWGTIAGGILGLVVFAAFPIVGAGLGIAGGGAIGKHLDKGVDKDFVAKVAETLKPENSALFVLVRDANQDSVLAALRPFRGTVLQSSLTPEAEEQLKQALREFE